MHTKPAAERSQHFGPDASAGICAAGNASEPSNSAGLAASDRLLVSLQDLDSSAHNSGDGLAQREPERASFDSALPSYGPQYAESDDDQ